MELFNSVTYNIRYRKNDSNSSHDYLWLIGVAIGGIGIVILFALLIKLCVTNRYDNVFSYEFILVKSHIHSGTIGIT
jgi:hypothetical protein